MRVHELAKKLGVSSKELLEKFRAQGVELKSHMSTLTDDQVAELDGGSPVAVAEAPEPASAAPQPEPVAAAPAAPPEPAPPPAEPETVAVQVVEDEPEPEPEPEPDNKIILKSNQVVVKEFAEMIGRKPNQLIAELMSMNLFATINQKIDLKIAQEIGAKHGFEVEQEKKKAPPPPPQVESPEVKKEKKKKKPGTAPEGVLEPRPPVVTFLGHVDHGKTSLLDRIRNTRVAKGEAGGITQHIGAYTIEQKGKEITFLDTPGHAAFTKMRARGANLTDIAIIVVAADEGLMPQTREALKHALAAEVTIMVAMNKMDLPGANPDKVKQQLQQEGLSPEDWGGDIICCPVSAETGEGIDELLEYVELQSEVLELTSTKEGPARGFVIEAQLEPGRGPTATLMVKEGTLKQGDAVICGTSYGKVKALINYAGKNVKTAGPSHAAKCLGLSDTPEAGAEFEVVKNDREARTIAEQRFTDKRQADLEGPANRKMSLEDLMGAGHEELPMVLKADVQGSVEAIVQSLEEIDSEKVKPKMLMAAVGNISENDVLLASASNAIIVGFNVGKDNAAVSMAKREGVEIRLYSIIYELLDDIRAAMQGLLEPVNKENVLGHAEIRQVFHLSKGGSVAGCMVIDGRIQARNRARVTRGRDEIYVGKLASLRRFQDEVKEVGNGQECGIRLENFNGFEEGDIIEIFQVESITQNL